MQQIQSPSAAVISLDGREVLSFAGCSYLGLAAVPELLRAGAKALVDQGATAQLARHYHAQSPANIDAEAEARRFFGTSGAMYFGGGYLFAMIAFAGIATDYDVAILDETAHFCIFDGARAAQKEICTFKHCDPADLERAVAAVVAEGKRFVVATDGMFPTFGRVAPLGRYARIIAPHDAWLIVDESHSFGSVGESGRGASELHGVAGPKTLIGGSLSKGYGAFGGIAVGTAEVIERLWQSPVARGSAAGMSAGAAMSAESFRYIRRNPQILERLKTSTAQLRSAVRSIGLQFEDVEGPVVAFSHGTAAQMRAAQQALLEDGIYILYSTYVGAGPEGVLRIAAFADHEPEHFERLADALARELSI